MLIYQGISLFEIRYPNFSHYCNVNIIVENWVESWSDNNKLVFARLLTECFFFFIYELEFCSSSDANSFTIRFRYSTGYSNVFLTFTRLHKVQNNAESRTTTSWTFQIQICIWKGMINDWGLWIFFIINEGK